MPTRVRIRSDDKGAKAGRDYGLIDEMITFKRKDFDKYITVQILNDDKWEPDSSFFLQLHDPLTGVKLEGEDTKTKITIIDDDERDYIIAHLKDSQTLVRE